MALAIVMLPQRRAFAQSSYREIGNPGITNYSPAEYKAHGQNFAVLQDKRGLMYFGNFSGILEFDGNSWRTIPTKNISKVSALAIDSSGKIYVGARGEIGYLQASSRGNLHFNSLTEKLSKDCQNFSEVRFIHAGETKIYFVTDRHLLQWDGKTFSSWELKGGILSAFYASDRLYILGKKDGLQYFTGNHIARVPGGEIFSETVNINAMISPGKGRILIASANQGLFMMTESGITPFITQADDYFRQNIISCGGILRDGTYVLGTERGGVINIYPDGSIKQIIKKANGLIDDNISCMYADNNSNLWLALNNGIARICTPSALSFFDSKNGIDGGVTGILREKNKLYFSTYKGVYVTDYSTGTFIPVSGINTSCWAMLPAGNAVIAATSKGVFLINNSSVQQQLTTGFSFTLLRSKKKPDIIYAGQTDGINIIKYENGQWTGKGKLAVAIADVTEIAEDDEENLWLCVSTKGIIRYKPDSGESPEYFDDRNGLPSRLGNHINETSAGVVISTQTGLFCYNERKHRFEKLKMFKSDPSFVDEWFAKITEDQNGNLWTNSGNEKNISVRMKAPGNKYAPDKTSLLPISDFTVRCIYPDSNKVIWLGGPDGAIRYNTAQSNKTNRAFPALIRAVYCNGDSLIFNGTFYNSDSVPTLAQNDAFNLNFDYSFNTIRFEFSSPAYNIKEDIKFQFFLEGFDKDWSDWTKETQKEYTNLPAGNFIFHVRAKNVYNQISSDAEFAFAIDEPFYQTWLARFIYLILLVSVTLIVVRIRSAKLIREKKKLENLIAERTAEVVSQKEEIEKQSVELGYKNQELEKINLIVKAINSEIKFNSLLISILEKTKVIGGVEQATMLVRDKTTDRFSFKAGYGWDISTAASVNFSWEEAQERYLENSDEIFEDIYSARDIRNINTDDPMQQQGIPKSVLIMLVKISEKPEGFLILENMHKKKAFDERDFSLLKNLKEHIISAFIKTNILEDLQTTLINLKETQEQLIRQEKLASIGQLTKGIVDRILNPLNYINNLSLITNDLALEIKEGLEKHQNLFDKDTNDDLADLLDMVEKNALKINEHGSSASRIVKGMEKLLRERSTEFVLTDINALVASHVEIAIQEIKKEYKDFKATIINNLDKNVGKVKVLPAEIGAVIVNMVNNACFSVYEKSKKIPGFEPSITYTTLLNNQNLEIRIRDNGNGIPQTEMKQLFAPFFTTKPTAKGTGLGLYMSLDIVKSHKGDILIDSKEGEYTEFTIKIPAETRENI